jgi:hypothetical protein
MTATELDRLRLAPVPVPVVVVEVVPTILVPQFAVHAVLDLHLVTVAHVVHAHQAIDVAKIAARQCVNLNDIVTTEMTIHAVVPLVDVATNVATTNRTTFETTTTTIDASNARPQQKTATIVIEDFQENHAINDDHHMVELKKEIM